MLRMKVVLNNYSILLPMSEVEIQFYHEDTVDDLMLLTALSQSMVELIEKVSNEYEGKFLSSLPRGSINKKAKAALFMTITFKEFKDMKQFEKKIGEMFK